MVVSFYRNHKLIAYDDHYPLRHILLLTFDQIKAKQAELKKTYDAKEYQRLRKSLYPSIEDVTVALAEKEEGDLTMWNEITKKRQDVKKLYPKP